MAIAEKKKVLVWENKKIEVDIYSMWIEDTKLAKDAKPGQFLSLYSADGSNLLPRPISICEIDSVSGRLRLVYRMVGKGTKEFSLLNKGDQIEVMGPIGNGFHLEGTKAILIGGGIGIPPMLELAKQLGCEKQIILGYRDITFMEDDFSSYGKVYISTEDGSKGVKGNVLDVIQQFGLEADIIYACGPTPMLKGIKNYAQNKKIKAQLSLEERMACGIGACLGCICKSKEKDHHSNVNNKRICKDGPVFYADDIEL